MQKIIKRIYENAVEKNKAGYVEGVLTTLMIMDSSLLPNITTSKDPDEGLWDASLVGINSAEATIKFYGHTECSGGGWSITAEFDILTGAMKSYKVHTFNRHSALVSLQEAEQFAETLRFSGFNDNFASRKSYVLDILLPLDKNVA